MSKTTTVPLEIDCDAAASGFHTGLRGCAVAVTGIGVVGELIPTVARLIDVIVCVASSQSRKTVVVNEAQIPDGNLRGGVELCIEQLVLYPRW